MEWVDNRIQIVPPKRPKKLTATRFATVLGLNPWSTPFEVWCEITRTYQKTFEDTIYTRAGKVIEPKQAEYMKNTYFMSNLVTPTDRFGEDYFKRTFGDFFPDVAVFGGMWDYLLCDKTGKPMAVLEMKTSKRVEDWAEDIPEYYALQAALYAHLLGVDSVIMVASFLDPSDYEAPENFVCSSANTITRPFKVSERYPDFEKRYVKPALKWWKDHAPASTKYHGNHEGGLFDHSLAVAKHLVGLTESCQLKWKNCRSPYLVGMFHDLCKIDQYRHPKLDLHLLDGTKLYSEHEWEYNPDTLLKGHEAATTFLPQFTLWLSCNDLPSVNDKSLFASDRVRVIEFNRHFSEDEQDKNLKTEFQTPEAMQGIFTWLLEGYFKYKRFGLKMSPAMRQVVKQYEKDNDMVLQFLEEKCEKAGGAYTRAKALYDAYKIWCKSNGYFVCSAKRFNADMEAHPEWHGGKTVYNGYPSYRDIRMKGTV